MQTLRCASYRRYDGKDIIWLEAQPRQQVESNMEMKIDEEMVMQHPTPLKTAPLKGEKYFTPNPMNTGRKFVQFEWCEDRLDHAWLERGLVYATKADAEAACDLMLAALKGGAA